MAVQTLTVGQRVTTSGYDGTIARHYSGTMYEIRLARGACCVCASDIKPREGEAKMALKAGDTVKFRTEVDPGDLDVRFELVWIDPPRAMIRLICDLPLPPTRIVLATDIVLA